MRRAERELVGAQRGHEARAQRMTRARERDVRGRAVGAVGRVGGDGGLEGAHTVRGVVEVRNRLAEPPRIEVREVVKEAAEGARGAGRLRRAVGLGDAVGLFDELEGAPGGAGVVALDESPAIGRDGDEQVPAPVARRIALGDGAERARDECDVVRDRVDIGEDALIERLQHQRMRRRSNDVRAVDVPTGERAYLECRRACGIGAEEACDGEAERRFDLVVAKPARADHQRRGG